MNGGYVSVSFFLLLSGFILTYNYAEKAQRGALSARSFWSARFSRLYPVYAFSLLLSAGMLMQEVQAHTKLDFGLGVILTPLLLQGWHPALTTFWNTPAWTMSTEAFFYLLFPWLITRRRPRQTRTILALLFAVWLSGLVLPGLYMHFNPDGDAHPDRYSVGIWMRALKFMPLQHLPSFLFGMGLGFLNEKIRPESRKRLAIGLLAFAALYLILCVGDRLPLSVMMHAWSTSFAFVRRRDPVPGWTKPARAVLWAAALHRHRRGQLLPIFAALQSLDAAARLAFSGEERPHRFRPLDLVPVLDRRCLVDQEAHRAARKKVDQRSSSTSACLIVQD